MGQRAAFFFWHVRFLALKKMPNLNYMTYAEEARRFVRRARRETKRNEARRDETRAPHNTPHASTAIWPPPPSRCVRAANERANSMPNGEDSTILDSRSPRSVAGVARERNGRFARSRRKPTETSYRSPHRRGRGYRVGTAWVPRGYRVGFVSSAAAARASNSFPGSELSFPPRPRKPSPSEENARGERDERPTNHRHREIRASRTEFPHDPKVFELLSGSIGSSTFRSSGVSSKPSLGAQRTRLFAAPPRRRRRRVFGFFTCRAFASLHIALAVPAAVVPVRGGIPRGSVRVRLETTETLVWTFAVRGKAFEREDAIVRRASRRVRENLVRLGDAREMPGLGVGVRIRMVRFRGIAVRALDLHVARVLGDREQGVQRGSRHRGRVRGAR